MNQLRKAIDEAWALPPVLKEMMGDYQCDVDDVDPDDYATIVEGYLPATFIEEEQDDAWVASELKRRNIRYEEGYECRASYHMHKMHAQECPMKYNWATFYLMLYDVKRNERSKTCTAPRCFVKEEEESFTSIQILEEDREAWHSLAKVVAEEYLAAAKRTFNVLGWKVHCQKICSRLDWAFEEAFCEQRDGYHLFEFTCSAGEVFLEASVDFMCVVGECVPAIFTATLKSAMVPLNASYKKGVVGTRYKQLRLDPPQNAAFSHKCTFAFEREKADADLFCQHQPVEDLEYLLHAIEVLNKATCVKDTDVLFLPQPPLSEK